VNEAQAQDLKKILTLYWGFSTFRPLQEEIIQSVLNKRDTLALLPTGGGKSLCFQLPALALEGICIVVSPLIALMKDQVENLKRKGIPAHFIIYGMNKREIDIILDNCIYGPVKFLYVSPERLSSELFLERLKKMKVSILAVDEAHCISQWGYDFRPSYLEIVNIRALLPGVPVIALTASATKEVVVDIQEKLAFKKNNVFKADFIRKNLAYIVFYEENKLQRLLSIIEKTKGSGIVYVRNRKKTQEIAAFLCKNKVKADYYHAGLNSLGRHKKQDAWMLNSIQVIVATNAFGMGIDKPDVRFVVHVDLPDTLEAYFQEAGRAGRDEKKAYCVLLYNNADKVNLEERILQNFPSREEIRNTYQALANSYKLAIGSGQGISFDIDLNSLCNTYSLNPIIAYSCLKILEIEGLLVLSESVFLPSRIHILLNNQDLYAFLVSHESYDRFLKIILRSYAGLFENYENIYEKEIASRANMPYEEVVRFLQNLHKMEVISYLPAKDAPQIVFTQPRIDANKLKISKKSYEDRKEKYIQKIESVIDYASRQSKCRSQMLLSYFGEPDSHRCGTCDVCIGRNKLELSEYEFEMVKDQVKQFLFKQPAPLPDTIKAVLNTNQDKVLKVIQWLIDNGKIILTNDSLLHYKD
jgi:ATP-dependent DNA helicase RecQ